MRNRLVQPPLMARCDVLYSSYKSVRRMDAALLIIGTRRAVDEHPS